MLKLLRLLTLTSLLSPLGSLAAGFEEGRHYTEFLFPQPVESGNQIEVREFFWYGCGHCYRLEPTLEQWLARKPKNVAFVRTPGTAPHWLVHAQLYYAIESLGLVPKLHGPIFEAIHKGGQRLDNENGVLKFVAAQGVDTGKFNAAFNSFSTKLNVEKAKRLNEAYTIHSVPMLVVDGKYLTSPAMAGGEAAVIKVVEFLVQKATAERSSRAKRGASPK
ncbi:MAG: thiol:disulfide interchange protein DsbA/DsbL [Gammaproteobacteria bacterium]